MRVNPGGKRNPGRIPRGRGGSGAHDTDAAGLEAGVKGFFRTSEILDALKAVLSRERLRAYLDAARGGRERALRLHARNTAAGRRPPA